MLELCINSYFFMVKGKCIPGLKKEEERGEAGPVRSQENRKYKGLVTLQPFSLPNVNPLPHAVSFAVSRSRRASSMLCSWTVPWCSM